MGGDEVTNYAASVPVTAQSMRVAVEKLKALDAQMKVGEMGSMLGMMTAFYDKYVIDELANYSTPRPEWAVELERKWGLR